MTSLARRPPIVSVVLIALVAASCGGNTETTTNTSTVATTTSSIADTTTTLTAPAEVLITFDGTTCSVSGGPLEPGFAQSVSVLNTSPDQALGLIIELNSSFVLDDLVAEVKTGLYDPSSPDEPPPYKENQVTVIMPPDATEATVQPFNARTGSWAVVCLDVTVLESRAFLAADVIQVSSA